MIKNSVENAENRNAMASREQIKRSLEIEEISNFYFIHPIAGRLAVWLEKWRVKPNAVSVGGMLCGLLAAISYSHFRDPRYAIAGFMFMLAWHIFDGADGQLARLTQSQSQSGKIMDGICDYVTFIAVYLSFGIVLCTAHGLWVWAVILPAGFCHAIQAAAYEVQRQEYCYWGLNQASAELPSVESLSKEFKTEGLAGMMLNSIYMCYVRMQWRVTGIEPESRSKLAGMIRNEYSQESNVRARYREIFAPVIRRWNILSSNYRTLGIFVAALLGVPIWYFGFELVVMSLITIILAARQRTLYSHFFIDLGERA